MPLGEGEIATIRPLGTRRVWDASGASFLRFHDSKFAPVTERYPLLIRALVSSSAPISLISSCSRHRIARQVGFTLMELTVVIGIISIMLVAVIPVVSSLSKSSGRKGAVSNLLGAIEHARAQAIKDGQATYVVFPAFSSGAAQSILDRYDYKSYALFEDDPANPTAPKQLTAWKTLPTGVSFRVAISSAPWTNADFAFTPISPTQTQSFPHIKFNANGELESPPGPATNVTIAVFEGHVSGGIEVITGNKDADGNPLATESIKIAHLTGRAERVP